MVDLDTDTGIDIGEVLPEGVLTNDNDRDSDTVTAIIVDDPLYGNVVLNNDGSFIYDPKKGYNGGEFFTYKAYDGAQYSNIVTVNINVKG